MDDNVVRMTCMRFCAATEEAGAMDYRKFGECYYIRLDRGDEVVSSIIDVCRSENVRSATFLGIGGCSDAEIQVFDPEVGVFSTERVESLLELVSLTGNVISCDDGSFSHHAHVLFAYQVDGQQCIIAGHLKSTTVLYTAEIELRPVVGGVINAELNDETGTYFWAFAE